jgi:ribosomal protein S18 acetylase RimI-like enzyme
MGNEDRKLDNPVWHSLSETHQGFSIDYQGVKFYQPDYCPFGSFIDKTGLSASIHRYAREADSFFIVGKKPELPNGMVLQNELVCDQMILTEKIDKDIKDDIIELGKAHLESLFELVSLVQPGYFRSSTSSLGHYYGIIQNGELIAVTGERMQMNDYIEVSAVVTHPAHTGKGYAKQLVAHTANRIFDQDKTPFLHVTETNAGAVKLYTDLGFQLRRKISFWSLHKSG